MRSLASNGECAVLVADCTPLVAYAQRIHSTLPTATAALGRGLVGGLLLGSFQKDGQTVQLSFKGGGPLGQSTCHQRPVPLAHAVTDAPLLLCQ